MDVIQDFSVITDHSGRIGAVRAVQHVIRLEKDERPYLMSDQKRQQLDECVHEMLTAGVIESSVSDYCSPAVLVAKTDGSVRFCTDYRRLHPVTKDKAAPKIQDTLRDFNAAKVFSAIDLKSKIWTLANPIRRRIQPLTTFATPDGASYSYQYKVMPFGLKNAPATFQKLMTRVLAGCLEKFKHVYLDDMIISKDHHEHLGYLRQVFECLQEYGLRCAAEKYKFGVTELPYRAANGPQRRRHRGSPIPRGAGWAQEGRRLRPASSTTTSTSKSGSP